MNKKRKEMCRQPVLPYFISETSQKGLRHTQVLTMAKYRETPCKYYISFGECSKGRDACHTNYCQHCGKYQPRARIRHINKKKQYNENIRFKKTFG